MDAEEGRLKTMIAQESRLKFYKEIKEKIYDVLIAVLGHLIVTQGSVLDPTIFILHFQPDSES